ncbi:MAG: hypothetical protein E7385_04490 [Ruminococcaceae bacterium]|nr:hypothetical protein [Oscillospiraceae bacterium]
MRMKKINRKIASLMILIIVCVLVFASGCEIGVSKDLYNTQAPVIEQSIQPGMKTPEATVPSPEGTNMQTQEPTIAPTQEPTIAPTQEPTIAPTQEPTIAPTQEPIIAPTQEPTIAPTQKPTATPTQKPTATPTQKPAATPTQKPTATPTQKPTATPTQKPTATPTQKPTATPTQKPTATPTQKPTATPTQKPTATPTQKPTPTPTLAPKELTPILQKDYFGRKWLASQSNSKKLLALYERFIESAETMADETDISDLSVTTQELNTVWQVYRNDYPQHFWIDTSLRWGTIGTKVVKFYLSYNMTESQKKVAQNSFNEAVEEILEKLDGNMSQYDLEKIIHDEIVVKVTYNFTDLCHTAYGALVEKTAVCDGFSKSFEYLCRLAGIQAYIVEGTSVNASTGEYENHAWNLVCLDGTYCLVDVTWDNAGEPERETIHYKYFNLTTKEMNEDHIPQTYDYPVPEIPTCTSTKYNYYARQDAILEELSIEAVTATVKQYGTMYVCDFEYIGNENVIEWIQNNLGNICKHLGFSSAKASILIVANEYTLILRTT